MNDIIRRVISVDLRIEDVILRKVVTIESNETVKAATDKMEQKFTSSLIVILKGKVFGILTTQDIVFRVVAEGLDPEKVKVKDVASRPVIMMRPDNLLVKAIKVMLEKKIKKIPLIEGDINDSKLVGLLSLTDVVEYHSDIFSNLRSQASTTDQTLDYERVIIET
jgi:CBS domain-containing protein